MYCKKGFTRPYNYFISLCCHFIIFKVICTKEDFLQKKKWTEEDK